MYFKDITLYLHYLQITSAQISNYYIKFKVLNVFSYIPWKYIY